MHQLGLEAADPLLGNRHVVGEIAAAADIDHGRAQRLVQRHHRLAEAPDARAVAERLAKGAAEHDPDVLDGVMLVDMEIAAGLNRKVEEAVTGEALEHVVKEGHAGVDRAASRAVELERNLDFGLARLALDLGRARGGRAAVAASMLLIGANRILPVRTPRRFSRVSGLRPACHIFVRCAFGSRLERISSYPAGAGV